VKVTTISLAATALVCLGPGCSTEEDLCAAAIQHLAACTGTRITPPAGGTCDTEKADWLLSADCAELAGDGSRATSGWWTWESGGWSIGDLFGGASCSCDSDCCSMGNCCDSCDDCQQLQNYSHCYWYSNPGDMFGATSVYSCRCQNQLTGKMEFVGEDKEHLCKGSPGEYWEPTPPSFDWNPGKSSNPRCTPSDCGSWSPVGSSNPPCYCNSACVSKGDCCPGYNSACLGVSDPPPGHNGICFFYGDQGVCKPSCVGMGQVWAIAGNSMCGQDYCCITKL